MATKATIETPKLDADYQPVQNKHSLGQWVREYGWRHLVGVIIVIYRFGAHRLHPLGFPQPRGYADRIESAVPNDGFLQLPESVIHHVLALDGNSGHCDFGVGWYRY